MSANNKKSLICPTCKKQFPAPAPAGKETDPSYKNCFPFCSARCRLVDLGQWFNGSYVIPCLTSNSGEVPDDTNDAG